LAMPAPIPFDAPVMMATLPASMFINFNLAVLDRAYLIRSLFTDL
jgi:hypothetical protein